MGFELDDFAQLSAFKISQAKLLCSHSETESNCPQQIAYVSHENSDIVQRCQ